MKSQICCEKRGENEFPRILLTQSVFSLESRRIIKQRNNNRIKCSFCLKKEIYLSGEEKKKTIKVAEKV